MATLDRALGLEYEKVAPQFKKAITKIVDETFDLSLRFGSQPPKVLDELKRKLIEQFPQVLNDPLWTQSERKKRMVAVYNHARTHFGYQRWLTKSFRVDGSMTRGTANEYRQKKRLGIRNVRRQYQRPKSSPSRDALPSSSSRTDTTLATPPTRQVERIKTCDSDTTPNIPRSTKSPSPSPSTSPTTLVESNPPSQMGPPPEALQTRAEDVADFLRTCIPDMLYFLPAFIEFGCRSRGFLEALASYSDEHIDHILRQMASNMPPGVVATEMDIWVLKQGLKKLVFTSKSSPINKRRL